MIYFTMRSLLVDATKRDSSTISKRMFVYSLRNKATNLMIDCVFSTGRLKRNVVVFVWVYNVGIVKLFVRVYIARTI